MLPLTTATVVLAFATAFAIDWRSRTLGLQPPGFLRSWYPASSLVEPLLRRLLGFLAIAFILWVGVFSPVLTLGQSQAVDFSQVPIRSLFWLHELMLACLAFWVACGFAGSGPAGWVSPAASSPEDRLDDAQVPPRAVSWPRHLGIEPPVAGWRRELLLGFGLGFAVWLIVLGVVFVVGLVTYWIGGEEALPKEPPSMIPWLAGLPILARLAISLSAGIVEEIFFRGFLQLRLGWIVPSVLFVLAHANYGQPIMLAGITVLSFVFAYMTRLRGNIWAAVAAHTTFDAVQLLILIPSALRLASQSPPVT